MKKLFLLTAFVLATLSINAEEGVVINGVKWATRNLDVGGTFVENPEDYGGYFQWGRPADGHENPTSSTTKNVSITPVPGHSNFILQYFFWYGTDSDNTTYGQNDHLLWNTGTEITPIKSDNDPSPSGWRVPTYTEMKSLLDTSKVSKTWDSTKKGYTFTDIDTGNSIFLPAAGWRDTYVYPGKVVNIGSNCNYWSSTYNNGFANGYHKDRNYNNLTYGESIRCVANDTSQLTPTVYITIGVHTDDPDSEFLGTTFCYGTRNLNVGIGDGTYDRNSNVVIYAIPYANNVFVSWSDGNTDNPRNITAVDDITLWANFESIDMEQAELLYNLTIANGKISSLQSDKSNLELLNSYLNTDLSSCNSDKSDLRTEVITLNGQIMALQKELEDCSKSNDIDSVKIHKTPIAFYNPIGIKLQKEPANGVYIVVFDDGSTEKRVR